MKFEAMIRACAAGVLLACGPAFAQGGATAISLAGMPRGYAAAAFESPVAFGASWGSVGVGVMGVRGDEHDDASMAVAAGLGDPDESVGLDAAVVFSSLSASGGSSHGFGQDGSVSLKLHRNLGNYTAIAVGATSVAGGWGSDVFHQNNYPGYHVAMTHALFVGDSVLMLSGGVGDNTVNKADTSHFRPDAFGSVAFYPVHWLSLIAEYNGFNADAAVSVAPLPQWLPLTLTVGYADLLSTHDSSPRLSALATLGYHF